MPARKQSPPAWFDLSRYHEAAELDAGEWLLNLVLRGWVSRTQDAFGKSVMQGLRPILRRGDAAQAEAFQRRFHRKNHEQPWGLIELLTGRPLRSGIDPVSVAALFIFEGRLPEDVRALGARFAQADDRSQTEWPGAITGRLDHAFNPQMLGRFVRVDLALPDSVLLHDLASFLKVERAELKLIGGKQPYRDAVRLADKTRPRLKTLATIGLLPFLDLQGWARSKTPAATDYAIANLIGTEPNRMREVHQYAERCSRDLALRAWLEPAARGMPAKGRRRAR